MATDGETVSRLPAHSYGCRAALVFIRSNGGLHHAAAWAVVQPVCSSATLCHGHPIPCVAASRWLASHRGCHPDMRADALHHRLRRGGQCGRRLFCAAAGEHHPGSLPLSLCRPCICLRRVVAAQSQVPLCSATCLVFATWCRDAAAASACKPACRSVLFRPPWPPAPPHLCTALSPPVSQALGPTPPATQPAEPVAPCPLSPPRSTTPSGSAPRGAPAAAT